MMRNWQQARTFTQVDCGGGQQGQTTGNREKQAVFVAFGTVLALLQLVTLAFPIVNNQIQIQQSAACNSAAVLSTAQILYPQVHHASVFASTN
jgi:hypothetical protein